MCRDNAHEDGKFTMLSGVNFTFIQYLQTGLETALGRTHFYLKSSDKITCINRVPVSGESKYKQKHLSLFMSSSPEGPRVRMAL